MKSLKNLADLGLVVVLLVLFQSGYGSAVAHIRIDNRVLPKMWADCWGNDGTDGSSDTIRTNEYWLFSIRPNDQRSKYDCRFQYAGQSHELTIYDAARGLWLGNYHWALNQDGGCLLMDSVGTWQCYSWNQ